MIGINYSVFLFWIIKHKLQNSQQIWCILHILYVNVNRKIQFCVKVTSHFRIIESSPNYEQWKVALSLRMAIIQTFVISLFFSFIYFFYLRYESLLFGTNYIQIYEYLVRAKRSTTKEKHTCFYLFYVDITLANLYSTK